MLQIAKASKRPSWVDTPIPRDQSEFLPFFAISDRYQGVFSRIFMQLSRSLFDAATKKRVLGVLRQPEPTILDVLNQFEFFTGGEDASQAIWATFRQSFEDVFANVIEASGAVEIKRQGFDFKLKVPEKVVKHLIEKQTEEALTPEELLEQIARRERAVRVPVNPFSLAWIETRSAQLVQGLSDQQRSMLQKILFDAFEQGQKPNAIIDQIEAVIGLTEREAEQVIKQKNLQKEAGVPRKQIKANAQRLGDKLLRQRSTRIARTEMIGAQNQGLEDTWSVARDQGELETETMKEWVEISSSPRTCPICRGLGGQQVPLGASFLSGIVGEVNRPPAHPNCRCTMVLVSVEPELQLDPELLNQLSEMRSGVPATP